ncbi:solute carrier family 23 protein [Pseudomonas sp. NPDC007930]|uniref:solute carrier family 23 protein n=1 Tax=Pseudomonas sp. NPDC007930 TaxID=3364417 RepID=UPI0036F00D13
MKGLFSWAVRADNCGVVAPEERLPWPQTIAMGIQHVFAMFGSTLLAPLLMGFDTNVAVLMSGIGTLIFFIVTRGKVPSYLGSSFAFIGVVAAATAYAGSGPNPNIPLALGGIVLCGLVYIAVGLAVQVVGFRWIERLMPPVVTGTVVAAIGLNLAAIPVKNMAASNFDAWMQLVTFVCVAMIAVFARGLLQRMLLLAGLVLATLIYFVLSNGAGLGKPIDFAQVASAPWFGLPHFQAPTFSLNAAMLIVPVVVILIAENLGHLKAIASIAKRDMDASIGRAFIGDGIATVVSGGVGGTGVTTYAENIGVMAATKVYSTALFIVAALVAILLGFSPKFGAMVQVIPVPVMGGVSIVVFGLIAIAGAKIWVENKVDFGDSRNLFIAAIPIVLGTGDFTLHFGGFALNGLGTATFGAILLNLLLGARHVPQPGASAH